jgi:hypothetical protein
LPSICLCRVMSASSAMVGASASQMSVLPTNVFAFTHPYRLHQGDLALLSAADTMGAASLCPACSRPGLHMHPYSRRLYCHRCRAVALERLYDKLLEINGFTMDIKRLILWLSFPHPFEVFKAEACALRTCHMTDLLRGPPWTYSPLWNTREAMEEDITRGVFWKGKRYTVGRLTAYQDFLSLVTDFLY